MTHPLMATCSVEGPRDLAHLARLLHEAGCSAAAWLVEAAAERVPELETELEDIESYRIPAERDEAYEDGYKAGRERENDDVSEVRRDVGTLVDRLDFWLKAKGPITKAALRDFADDLGEIAYPKEEAKAA